VAATAGSRWNQRGRPSGHALLPDHFRDGILLLNGYSLVGNAVAVAVASKDAAEQAPRHFQTNNHPPCLPVRSRFVGAAAKSSRRTKVTYWVTLVFFIGLVFVTESPASWLLHPNQAEASFEELDPKRLTLKLQLNY